MDDGEAFSQNYKTAHEHWSSVASDINGMLGGFQRLHAPDVNGSRQFVDELAKKNLLSNFRRALDCGSGIGRVTKHLLLPVFDQVDMVDFAEQFITKSAAYIGEEGNARVDHKFVESLHTFTPEPGGYDCIWIQWVTGQLTDSDFVGFLQRCKAGIRPNGCVVVKDNIAKTERDFDETDNSWTRTAEELHSIFTNVGFNVALERKQLHFPKDIYEVRMFALKPIL